MLPAQRRPGRDLFTLLWVSLHDPKAQAQRERCIREIILFGGEGKRVAN